METDATSRKQTSTAASKRVGPFSLLSPLDGASLVLGRLLPSGRVTSQGFTSEEKAKARARKLGEGWEAWTTPGASHWFVRRVPRGAYDPSTGAATYTVLGPAEDVMARFVTADAVPTLIRRAKGDASVFDDRDGNRVISGTDGAPATIAMVETRLEDYEAAHVVARRVVSYFTDSNNPGRALNLGQLDYDPAKNYLDPRDERAIEALAPGESHHPLAADPDEGPFWGVVTRVSAATQPKALVRGGVVLGVGFNESEARADATGRSPTEAEAADVEIVNASLAALSGWHDDELRERVYLAPDGSVRRIDVFDVLPHDQGTPNDPRWYTDEGAEPDDDEPGPAAPVPAAPIGGRFTVFEPEALRAGIARVEGPGWLEQQALMVGAPYSFDGAIDRWTQGLGGVIHGAHGLHRYVICADGEVVYSESHGWAGAANARAEGFRMEHERQRRATEDPEPGDAGREPA